MALHKIGDRHPDYQTSYFSGKDLKGMAVFSADGKKTGRVTDLLVDDTDAIAYLVIKTGGLLSSRKQVLLPINFYAHNSAEELIYVHTLSKADIKALPTYDVSQVRDNDYEKNLA